MSNVGRTIRFKRDRPLEAGKADASGNRLKGYQMVDKGAVGTVISEENNGESLKVHYALDNGRFAVFTHARGYEGRSWEFVTPTTASMTIESERSYALYVASSSEDIKGYVPQVRYREEIIWQGEPVPTTDDSGEPISKGEQSANALKAAEDKITEVVKKQFA